MLEVSDGEFLWSDADQIAVFDTATTNRFQLTQGAGTAVAVFAGEAQAGTSYRAFYPYDALQGFSAEGISAVLPQEQTWTGGDSFPREACLGVAVADDDELNFDQVVGGVAILLEGLESGSSRQVEQIRIASPDQNEALSGACQIRFTSSGFAVEAAAEGGASVTLKIADELTGDSDRYLAAVMPGEYTSLDIAVLFADDTFVEQHFEEVSITSAGCFEARIECSDRRTLQAGHDPFGIIETLQPEGDPVASYRNKYGMVIDEYADGAQRLKRERALKEVLGNGLYDLDEVLTRYVYTPDRITSDMYAGCTSQVLTFTNRQGDELKIYAELPEQVSGPTPFIVWIHGGGWRDGTPETSMKNESQYFASQGYASFRVQYRLMDAVGSNEEQLQDIADAVAFIKDQAGTLNVDPQRYAYVGGSAGGQLAIISAINDSDCRALVSLYAVCDVKGFYEFLVRVGQRTEYEAEQSFFFMEDSERYGKLSPSAAVVPGMAPMLVIHGTGDSTAPYALCEEFMQAMDRAGNQYEKKIYEYYDHNFTGKGASAAYEDVQLTMLDFLSRNL